MGKDNDFRKLVELIFAKKFATKKEILGPESSMPICFQTNDFYPKLRYILFMRYLIIVSRWEEVVKSLHNMLESYELYVTAFMKSFINEQYCSLNAFDTFLSACCVAKFFSEETFQCTNVDLSDLHSDMIMEFYDSVLKKLFLKRGGIQGFVEYVRNHKYLTWEWDRKDMLSGEPFNQVNKNTISNLQKEFEKEMKYQVGSSFDKDTVFTSCMIMAEKVLSATSVKLPTLPSKSELIKRVVEFRKRSEKSVDMERVLKSAAELEVLENLRKEFTSPNPESVVNQEVKENKETKQYGSLVQAVINYNRSRSSDLENLNNPLLKEANEILELLKKNIESLIEVLDDYVKE